MKTKFIALLVIIAASFTGCKNDKSVDSLPVENAVVVDNGFKITAEVIVKKDDDFSFYYTEDGSIDFTKIPPIWFGVKGSDNVQQVSCTLPEDVYPTQLRLDFGIKPNQEDIVLKSVTLEYKGAKKVITGADLITFFRADETKCTFDAPTGVIKAVVKDGVRQHPSLYPQEANLGPELVKLGN